MTSNFMTQIAAVDPTLFQIVSQTSEGDKQSLLYLQNIVRNTINQYTYLEVGSHLGGTLFPYLVDDRCGGTVSVDPRPLSQPDERGRSFQYEENSTARMIGNLERVVPRGMMTKLRCYDIDASHLPDVGDPVCADLALIDGEHTNKAAFRDFLNVLNFMKKDCIIAFHDSQLVFDAISNAEAFLAYDGRPHRGFYLPDCVYAFAIGSFARFAGQPLERIALDSEQYISRARLDLYHSISANLAASLRLKVA